MCKTKIGVLEMVFLEKLKNIDVHQHNNLNNEKSKIWTYLKDETEK